MSVPARIPTQQRPRPITPCFSNMKVIPRTEDPMPSTQKHAHYFSFLSLFLLIISDTTPSYAQSTLDTLHLSCVTICIKNHTACIESDKVTGKGLSLFDSLFRNSASEIK